MNLRTAEKRDLESISALLRRCYPKLMSGAYSDDILEAALPAMTRANPELIASGCFYLVETQNDIIGCGGWSLETPGTNTIVEDIAHIRHFAVDPQHTKKGIGQQIFARCAFEARQSGAKSFQAFSSLNAEPFYRKMGLKRLKQINVLMDGEIEFPVVFMQGLIAP